MAKAIKYSTWAACLAVMFLCGCPPQNTSQMNTDGQSPSSKPAPTSYQQELLKQIEDLEAQKKIAEDRLNDIRIRDNLITNEYNKLKMTVQQQDQQIKLIGEAITQRDALREQNLQMQAEILRLRKENQHLKDVIKALGPASAPAGGR